MRQFINFGQEPRTANSILTQLAVTCKIERSATIKLFCRLIVLYSEYPHERKAKKRYRTIKKTTMKFVLALGLLLLLNGNSYGQDTLRLEKKPEVILKSWYPEFKEFPYLKVGDTKMLFTIIPEFENLSIRDNDINLEVNDSLVKIEETGKTNQYLITVHETNSIDVEFEIWFDIGARTILLKEMNKWTDIRKIYPFKENRVMLQKVKLKIAH